MKTSEKAKLERLGYRVTDTTEFLGLSDAEARLVDLKVSLIERIRDIRRANRLTQKGLAKLIKSSQSRVAMMEAGSPDVSLDLICRALFALGEAPARVAKKITRAQS